MIKYFAFLLFALYACSSDNFEELHPGVFNTCDTTVAISYDGEISQILSLKCGSGDINCHKTGNVPDVNLDSYSSVKDIAMNGDLLGTIMHQQGFAPMPLGQPRLDDCTINKITAWVNRGMPE